jgi:uncharacterized protein YehS (DUF1456 family)
MTNNDIIRRLRYTFSITDDEVIELFDLGNMVATPLQLIAWFKKEEDEGYTALKDVELASFLNGFISKKRGKKDGAIFPAEEELNNNIILRKLKIALNLKDVDIIDVFKLADLRVSKHELSALFRKPDHPHYRACKNQFLRNFLLGLQLRHRPK